MTHSTMDDLMAGLAAERAAILKGSYETLTNVARAREGLFAAAPKLTVGEAQLLLEKIERNQRLLSSAIRGVQAAMGRVSDIDRAHTRLGTYRPDGSQGPETGGSARLEHRA